ncbi:hypothetical protein niasHS_014696 [Heterodera schachtii]|uniref:Uncharacterized protein n=1 Tax=Heterodera schachtii TaxID=97005 RepID=A0ABD2IFC7_HETSC
MFRRSVTASLLPSSGTDHRRHSHQTITVVENSRHRRQQKEDDHRRRMDASEQLAKEKMGRWSDILGGWSGNGGKGRDGRRESDGGDSAEELIAALKSLQSSGKMTEKAAEAQTKGAKALAKWASKSKNETMADIVGRVSELMEMHAERQRTFAKDYGHYLKQLQKVAETEREMHAQCRKVEKLTDQEKRVGKMLAKRGEDDSELRAKLERVKREREWAERETEEERKESEFARMAHLEAALKGMANVQLNLARAGQLIFTCQSELTALVKERTTPMEGEGQTRRTEQQQQQNGGVSQTKQKLIELRRSLETSELQLAYNAPSSVERRQRHRRSDPSSAAGARLIDRFVPNRTANAPITHSFGTPPPPYSPSAPPLELLDSITRSSAINRHSVGSVPAQTAATARIYPQLPPNPFAEELKLRRRCGGPRISVE